MTTANPTPAASAARPRATSHGFVTRGIHWLSAAMIAYGYAKGLDGVNQLADPALFRFEVLFAVALGLLFAVRLVWTQTIAGATRLPDSAPKWEQLASRMVHLGLYGAVFTIVGSGLGIAYGYASPMLGRLFVNTMVMIHEAALALLPVLIAVHIAGALWHKVVRRDGVLESMTGTWRR